MKNNLSNDEATIGPGQAAAAQVWNMFRAGELRYVDILEMCAVLMINVADKAGCSDHEIADMTRRLAHDARSREKKSGPILNHHQPSNQHQ